MVIVMARTVLFLSIRIVVDGEVIHTTLYMTILRVKVREISTVRVMVVLTIMMSFLIFNQHDGQILIKAHQHRRVWIRMHGISFTWFFWEVHH